MIRMFDPVVSENVVQQVAAALRTGWLSEGRQVKSFEERFCEKFALPRALALNNGTAALHLALLGAALQPGDEVITSAQTFVATAMAILYVGALPVFADLQENTPNLDPAQVEKCITPRTRAILVVHYGGYPCDMDEIAAIAARHRLVVIEDAAHALGATYKKRPIGALGDFAIFSFQAIKQLTTGDGGMIVCRSEEAHKKAYRQRWFGIDRAGRKPTEVGQPEWPITEIGYKYHMNDIAATMGLAQLGEFENGLERRRELNLRYRAAFEKVNGVGLLEEKPDRESGCWLFTARVQRRLDFVRALRDRGVEASVWHQRIDENPLFGGMRKNLPNQALFTEEQVSVPLRSNLTDNEVDQIMNAVKAGW